MVERVKLFKTKFTLNKISETGLCRFSDQYTCATDAKNPDAILVRSASMHDM